MRSTCSGVGVARAKAGPKEQPVRLFDDVPTESEAFEERRGREADYTPVPTAVAIIERMLEFDAERGVVVIGRASGLSPAIEIPLEGGGLHVLDVCAGAGPWSIAVRRIAAKLGLKVHITAVEFNPKDCWYLQHHADEVIIGDYRTAFVGRRYHLMLGNPPFSLVRAAKMRKSYDPSTSMVAVGLRHGVVVMLYNTQQALTKTGPGRAVRRAFWPALIVDIPDGIGHRGPGQGMDSIPYSVTCWAPGVERPTIVDMLDELPIESRTWSVRPGTEGIDPPPVDDDHSARVESDLAVG